MRIKSYLVIQSAVKRHRSTACTTTNRSQPIPCRMRRLPSKRDSRQATVRFRRLSTVPAQGAQHRLNVGLGIARGRGCRLLHRRSLLGEHPNAMSRFPCIDSETRTKSGSRFYPESGKIPKFPVRALSPISWKGVLYHTDLQMRMILIYYWYFRTQQQFQHGRKSVGKERKTRCTGCTKCQCDKLPRREATPLYCNGKNLSGESTVSLHTGILRDARQKLF